MKLNLQIELTNQCNFRCRYCPHSLYGETLTPGGNRFTRPLGSMSPSLFKKATREAMCCAEHVSLGFFGEQLLHPRFSEFILSVPRERPFSLFLNTNWSLATEDMLDALRRFDVVRISLDAADKETWERLCPGGVVRDNRGIPGNGRYETLTEKIRWWLSLEDRPKTWIVCVRKQGNEGEDEIVRMWKPLLRKGDCLVTKAMLTYGGVMRDPTMKPHACDVHQGGRFTVGWDGTCSPCNLDVNLELSVGNLNTQSVEEIVSSERWTDVMEDIKARRGICANCFDAGNHSQRFYHGE